jgi:hypothetical protein
VRWKKVDVNVAIALAVTNPKNEKVHLPWNKEAPFDCGRFFDRRQVDW